MEKAWLGIVAFAVAWFVAQTSKTIIGFIKGDAKQEIANLGSFVKYFGRSGGMPSGHTASFTAMAVFLGCLYGFTSAYFVIAACTWTIIVYDATHVRYAVGEQAKVLNTLLKKDHQPELPVIEGHTVPQVIVGAIIGVVIGALLYLCLGM